MLYISTRNPKDTYTAYRALHEQNAPDGGMYVPFQKPVLSAEDLQQLYNDSFGQNVAKMLNRFFAARLTGWDVECAVGRNPVKLTSLGRRTIVGELWHNLELTYSGLEKSLYVLLTDKGQKPIGWSQIAIRIAVICGLMGELHRAGIKEVDVAVAAGDFSTPIAVWYCRQMGLPIGMIICGCNENGALWDLLHRGECNTGAATVKTDLPELDVAFPAYLEQLIFATQSKEEFARYLGVAADGGVYALEEENLAKLNDRLCASVVGSSRVDTVISSVYRTNDCFIDPVTALSYGSLQDYRARTGENRMTVLLADYNPKLYADRVANAVGISNRELLERLRV
jgi:threonine synthase